MQSLKAALQGQDPQTTRELSVALSLPEKDVIGLLEKLQAAGRRRASRLRSVPPACASCGFCFEARRRIARPGRCPECRSERVHLARYWLEPEG